MILRNVYTSEILLKMHLIVFNRHYLKHLGIVLKNLKPPKEAYNKFLEIFIELCEKYFPTRKIKIKPKRALSPWIIIDVAKSSKQKKSYMKDFKAPHTYQRNKLSSLQKPV